LGSGPATYGYDFSLNRPKDFNNNNFYNLRFFQGTGLLFEVIPVMGILGTIFLLIVILSFLGAAFYFLYRQKEKNKLYSLGIFSAAVILIITVLSVKIEGTILILAALLSTLAIATLFLESDAKEDVLPLTLQASPKFALALAFVFMVVSAGVAFLFVYIGKIYAADVYAGAAGRITAEKAGDTVVNMSKAIRLYQGEGKYFTQLGQYYMVLANTEAVKDPKERNIDSIQLYLNNSVAAANQGKEMSKNDITSVEALAQIYENAGLYVKDSLNLATENYKRGLELEPHNPVFYDKLGQIKVALASTEKDQKVREGLVGEARDMFQKSVDEKQNYDPAYYQLGLVQEALGNIDEAIKNAEIAYQLSPRNPNYLLTLGKLYQGKGGEEFLARAENAYRALVTLNDKDINGHFYLGLLYEKEKKKKEAVDEYQKVKDLLTGDANIDTRKQLDKMIANVQAGIENTPESLGLVQPKPVETPANATENPNTTNPTLENATQPNAPEQPAP
jgi:tetratricopeptide (TPR) repeat protein